jgi:hypothetical protein
MVFDSLRYDYCGTAANNSRTCDKERLAADVSLQSTSGVKHWLGAKTAAAYSPSFVVGSVQHQSNGMCLAALQLDFKQSNDLNEENTI